MMSTNTADYIAYVTAADLDVEDSIVIHNDHDYHSYFIDCINCISLSCFINSPSYSTHYYNCHHNYHSSNATLMSIIDKYCCCYCSLLSYLWDKNPFSDKINHSAAANPWLRIFH